MWLVGAFLFVDMAAYSAITPLLPGYAEDLALSKAETGVLGAAFAAGTFAGALPGGWVAARIGGRATVLIGLATMSFAAIAFAVGTSVAFLDAARFVQGVGGAFTWSGALAWLVAATPKDRRGAVIGTALGAAIAGTLAGPGLGAVAEVVGTEAVFGGLVVLAALLAALAMREPALPPAFPVEPGDLRRIATDRRVYGGMWLIAFPGLAFGVINVLGPLRFDELGARGGDDRARLPARRRRRGGHEPPRRPALGPPRADGADAVRPRGGRAPRRGAHASRRGRAARGRDHPHRSDARHVVGAGARARLRRLESRSLDPALGYGLTNLSWAAGAAVGASGGASLADATADAVPYLLLAALAVVTLGVIGRARGRVAVPAGA